MARFFNVNPDGQPFRLINCDHIMEIQIWAPKDGQEAGTQIRMHASDMRDGTTKPFLIAVATPFSEIMRRIQNESLLL